MNILKYVNSKIHFERNNLNSYNFFAIEKRVISTNRVNHYMKINQRNDDLQTQTDFKNKLSACFNTLKTIPQLSKDDADELIYGFMSSIGKLYLVYFQDHLDDAHALARDHQETLEKAIPLFRSYGIKLENFLMGIFEGFDEWEVVCYKRTNIEAFNAMFGEVTRPIDIEDIEDCMQQRKNNDSITPCAAPPHVPKSHWWWFV